MTLGQACRCLEGFKEKGGGAAVSPEGASGDLGREGSDGPGAGLSRQATFAATIQALSLVWEVQRKRVEVQQYEALAHSFEV